ncbi:MAG TPA: ScpA family protein [Thermomicrobiales bacterium]|nr:ScpA family protein [Thermomicrobiales bacterium]
MVTTAPDQPDMLSNYQLRLPGYEGPLDVLLRLIERNQLEITDVSLVAVTSQFLDYMAELTEAPTGVIASFTTVGTRLAVLKSRSLLPRPAALEDDDGPSDLTRQLLEYRMARDASAFLNQRAEQDLRSYGRSAPGSIDPALRRASERLVTYPASALVNALRRRLTVVPKPPQMVPARKVVSLRDTVSRILELTGLRKRVSFNEVVGGYTSRTEVATAFLGMLVLVRRNVIAADQTDLFGDIHLDRNQHIQDAGVFDERFDSAE